MMATMITMSHDYDAPARELWRIATDWNCLRRAVGKMVIFGPLPDEPMHKGQVIRTTVSLFGVLPAFAYTLKIREFDATAMHLETSESGGGIDAGNIRLMSSPAIMAAACRTSWSFRPDG